MNKSINSGIKNQKNGFDSDWADGLPYEILLQIFRYHALMNCNGNMRELNKIKNVCKNWSIVANDAKLWHNLKFSTLLEQEFTSNTTDKITIQQNVFKIETKIKSLCSNADLKANFNYIRILDLSDLYFLTCDHLELILSNCNSKNIFDLSLANCKKINNSNENKLFENVIADYCQNLNYLNLSGLLVNLLFISLNQFMNLNNLKKK